MKYNINESVEKIVEDMRKLTMLTGQLSMAHEESLYAWALILFNDVENVEIKYDLTKDYTKEVGEGYVIYNLDIPVDKIPKEEEFHKRCEILARWVRDMFWNEIKVEVQTKLCGYSNTSLKPGKPMPNQIKPEDN
jgi:hypothetical protein